MTLNNVELDTDVTTGRVRYPHGIEIVYLPIDDLSPHPMNANATDIDPIVESIEMNGFINPVLVQKSTGYIIDGFHRWSAAISLGAETIPCIVYDCDDATAKRLLVAINRTARLGTDDPNLLRSLMDAIRQDNAALIGTGWTPSQYDNYLHLLDNPYGNQPDVAPARQRSGRSIMCPQCGHEFGGHQ